MPGAGTSGVSPGGTTGVVSPGSAGGAGRSAGLVVVGVEGAVGAGGTPGEACGPGLPRGCLGALFFFWVPGEGAARLLALLPVTLVLAAATPDEYEPEAFFDRMGELEMDGFATRPDRIAILSGLGADPAGAPSGGGWPGETTRGAATTQTTKVSVASVIMPARAKKSGRSPQTGLIDSILTREPLAHYPSYRGGRRS